MVHFPLVYQSVTYQHISIYSHAGHFSKDVVSFSRLVGYVIVSWRVHSMKLTHSPWKSMVGSDEFPFGARPPESAMFVSWRVVFCCDFWIIDRGVDSNHLWDEISWQNQRKPIYGPKQTGSLLKKTRMLSSKGSKQVQYLLQFGKMLIPLWNNLKPFLLNSPFVQCIWE